MVPKIAKIAQREPEPAAISYNDLTVLQCSYYRHLHLYKHHEPILVNTEMPVFCILVNTEMHVFLHFRSYTHIIDKR